MMISLLKSKIHRATVTNVDLNYEGSITIDGTLCKAARLSPHEKVDIYNINNGARFSTYVFYGEQGEICVNGAAARWVQKGDKIIIASFGLFEPQEISDHKPIIILVDEAKKEVGEYNEEVRKIVEKEEKEEMEQIQKGAEQERQEREARKSRGKRSDDDEDF